MAALLAFFSDPVYRATVTAVPTAAEALDANVNDVVSRLGGVATLFGANAGISGGSTQVAVELLKSKSFARSFVETSRIHEVLTGCVPADVAVTETDDCKSSVDRAARRFDREVRRVSFDRRTNIVTLAIDWTDPNVAAAWANNYMAFLNARMRSKAMSDSKRNISFLTQQLDLTNSVEIRAALFRLMEVELKNAMLAEVREEYALKIIDPAIVPGQQDIESPKLWLWTVGGLAGGLILGFLFAMAVELRALARSGN